MHQLNQTPNYRYLSHPINSFHLIRHVASGWDNIVKYILKDEVSDLPDDLGRLKNIQILPITSAYNIISLLIVPKRHSY